MITRYIILNGPPGSGKTTFARWLSEDLAAVIPNAVITNDSFAAPMKHLIAVALGVKYNDLKKDIPLADLNGYTPREFLIHFSEQYIKPRYGDDAFGRWLVHRTLRNPPDYLVCDDGGFTVEYEALSSAYPMLVRIIRPGCDYTKDSRSYLDNPTTTIYNDGSLEKFREQSHSLAIAIRNFK